MASTVPALTPTMAPAAPISRFCPERMRYQARGSPITSLKNASINWLTAVGTMFCRPWAKPR